MAYLAAMGWLAELHPVGWLAELQPVLADPKQSRPKVVQACLAKLVQASLLEASLQSLQQLQASLLEQLHGVELQALEAARACSQQTSLSPQGLWSVGVEHPSCLQPLLVAARPSG